MHRYAQGALFALIAGTGILISPAAAQTTPPASQCAAIEPLPPMPNGATATRAQIDAYNATYNAWAAGVTTAITCRRDEATQMRAAAQPRVAEFNSAQARLNAINTYWTALLAPRAAPARGEEAPAAPAIPDVSTLGSGPLTPPESTSQCAAIPEPPAPPNVERSNERQLRRAVEAYNAWLSAAQTSLTCRHDEAIQVSTAADALVAQYNASARSVTETSASWAAEVAEYNAR